MSGKSIKRNKRAMRKVATEVYSKQHLEIIRGYIDGIIDLPFRKRLKVCLAILNKRNPFKSKRSNKKGGKK